MKYINLTWRHRGRFWKKCRTKRKRWRYWWV